MVKKTHRHEGAARYSAQAQRRMGSVAFTTLAYTLGAVLSIMLAEGIGLQYGLSAGVVTLLTFLDVKRQALKTALQRFCTALIALAFGAISFSLFGFNLWGFGLYLMAFIPICLQLQAKAGLVVNTVLVSHIYTNGRVTTGGIFNELALISIGILIALIINLHRPNIESEIRALQQTVDEDLKEVLRAMSRQLKNYCAIQGRDVTLDTLQHGIEMGLEMAKRYNDSYYIKSNQYFLRYFEMRRMQCDRLGYMKAHLQQIFTTQQEADLLSSFTTMLADQISEYNTGDDQIDKLLELKSYYKQSQLPMTREEFENRAALFQYLNDLESFILIKKRFMQEYGSKA